MRRTPRAEAFLWAWLQASLRSDVMAELPNPEPHRDFRWHTHEQCLFSIVAATHHNTYRRNFSFCWTLEREQLRDLSDARCRAPTSHVARAWFPANASRRGHCLGIECPHLSPSCARHKWALPWARTRPGASCAAAFAARRCS